MPHMPRTLCALSERVFCSHIRASVDCWKPHRKISKMAGNNAEAALDINIDTKRSSSAVVREALFRATGEQKWTVHDEWASFLVRKAFHSIFHDSYSELLETTIHYLQ